MENLNLDVLIKLALELNDIDLLALCTTNKSFNEKICNRDTIWRIKLKNYETLGFENLNLSPRQLYNLLKSLTIVKNHFKLKDTLLQLYDRKELSLIDIHQEIPKELGNLINLQKLSLSHKDIKQIPKELENLFNLEILSLTYNQIEKIPKELGNLSNLQTLNLTYNKIQEIPKELGKLTNLKRLEISNNKIKKIPKELSNLFNLEELILSVNEIKEVPKELGNLSNLQKLDLSYNQIEKIPKELGKLINLKKFNLSGNKLKIKKMPKEVQKLPIWMI